MYVPYALQANMVWWWPMFFRKGAHWDNFHDLFMYHALGMAVRFLLELHSRYHWFHVHFYSFEITSLFHDTSGSSSLPSLLPSSTPLPPPCPASSNLPLPLFHRTPLPRPSRLWQAIPTSYKTTYRPNDRYVTYMHAWQWKCDTCYVMPLKNRVEATCYGFIILCPIILQHLRCFHLFVWFRMRVGV